MPYEMLCRIDGVYKYGKKVDIWCLGVLLFSILYGSTPFYNKETESYDKETVRSRIKSLKYEFPNSNYPLAEDLIRKILVEPHKRLSLDQILKHEWLQ
jgi:serine/threonine protein kinase